MINESMLVEGFFRIQIAQGHGPPVEERDIWCPNLVTDEGWNRMAGAHFGLVSAVSNWYVTLIKSNTVPASNMTYAVPVYTEVAPSDISTPARPLWAPSASNGLVSGGTSPASIVAGATFTVRGVSLVGDVSTFGDTAGGGVLHSYSQVVPGAPVQAGNLITVTYSASKP